MADTLGGPVFIAGALPGEIVLATPGARRGEGLAATLTSIEHPSEDRVSPPCPHFLIECGACALQHLATAPYLNWKRGRLVEALSRAGQSVPLSPLIAAEPGTRRRAGP